MQLAHWLMSTLQPLGAGVVLEAEHLCMSIRGVQAAGTLTRTSAFRGVLAEANGLRDPFFD